MNIAEKETKTLYPENIIFPVYFYYGHKINKFLPRDRRISNLRGLVKDVLQRP